MFPLVKKRETSKNRVNDHHTVISSTTSNNCARTEGSLAEKDLNTRRNALKICFISRQAAKPAIASAAHSLAQAQIHTQNRRLRKAIHSRTGGSLFQLSVDQFDRLLESKSSFLPDFWIYSQYHVLVYSR